MRHLALALLLATPALAQDPAASPARPVFKQDSLNVFRRYAGPDQARMIAFYKDALGLPALQPIQLTAAQQVLLFRVGTTGQIKLTAELPARRKYHLGAVKEATGIRLYTFSFRDEAALVARFRAAGLPAPAFRDMGGRREAMVKDPVGFNIRLVIDPAAPTTTSAGVEVGVGVSDLARSRSFYRDFAGLEELPPVRDAGLGVTKYPFRRGETTVSLFFVGPGHPADTGSAGMQYVIGNIDAVNAAAAARNVTVETPLGGVAGFNVRTVWLNDPDGVTNYFYQMGARAPAPARQP